MRGRQTHSLPPPSSPRRAAVGATLTRPLPLPCTGDALWSLGAQHGWAGPSMRRPRPPLLAALLLHGRDYPVRSAATRSPPSSPGTGTRRPLGTRYAPASLAPDLSSCVAARCSRLGFARIKLLDAVHWIR
jgi:hypothetical protein